MQPEFEFIVVYKEIPYWRRQMAFPFFREYCLEMDGGYVYAPYIPLLIIGGHEDKQLRLWEDTPHIRPRQSSFEFLDDCYTEYIDCHTDDNETIKWWDRQIEKSNYLYRSIDADELTKRIAQSMIEEIDHEIDQLSICTLIKSE